MRLAILGASGHGKVVADTALQAGWQDVVFFDDAWPGFQSNGSWSVVGDTQRLIDQRDDFDGIIVGIGNNQIRLQKARELETCGTRLVTLVHPRAIISSAITLGRGSVVFAGAIIQIDSRIGAACIINTGATVDHECILSDGVHISPGVHLAGGVHVGERSFVGIGAVVKPLVEIGVGVTVGAGAAVMADVPDGQTVVGVPAKFFK